MSPTRQGFEAPAFRQIVIITEFKSPLLSLRCQLSTVNCQLFKVAPGEPAALLNFPENAQQVSRWSFIELIPASDMVATLAALGDRPQLLCWQW